MSLNCNEISESKSKYITKKVHALCEIEKPGDFYQKAAEIAHGLYSEEFVVNQDVKDYLRINMVNIKSSIVEGSPEFLSAMDKNVFILFVLIP